LLLTVSKPLSKLDPFERWDLPLSEEQTPHFVEKPKNRTYSAEPKDEVVGSSKRAVGAGGCLGEGGRHRFSGSSQLEPSPSSALYPGFISEKHLGVIRCNDTVDVEDS
jgi:hypothetical protein